MTSHQSPRANFIYSLGYTCPVAMIPLFPLFYPIHNSSKAENPRQSQPQTPTGSIKAQFQLRFPFSSFSFSLSLLWALISFVSSINKHLSVTSMHSTQEENDDNQAAETCVTENQTVAPIMVELYPLHDQSTDTPRYVCPFSFTKLTSLLCIETSDTNLSSRNNHSPA